MALIFKKFLGLNQCSDAICNFNGICNVINGQLTCTCNPNFTGETCATQLPCSQVACSNGGTVKLRKIFLLIR